MRIATSAGAMMVAVVLVVTIQGLAQDTAPPAPGQDWQQEEWSGVLPEPGQPRRSSGRAGAQSFTFGPADFQQRMQEMQSRIFGMPKQLQDMQHQAQQTRDDATRMRLGVNDQQWAQIKPYLNRIDELKDAVNASVDPGGSSTVSTFSTGPGGGGGAWSGGFTTFGSTGPGQNWSRTETFGPGGSTGVTRRSGGEPTQAEKLCEELDSLLQSPGVAPGEVARKVAALRQAKQRAQTQLQRQRSQLRTLVDPQQEAVLIVMGYLD